MKKPSEILFQAHRTTMSDEDILGVLYSNKGDLQGFSNKIINGLSAFIPKDSLLFKPYQTTTEYLLNSKAYKEVKQLGSNFLQKRPFNTLTYRARLDNREYKFHEFHIAFNSKTTLRFIWIADIQKTIVNSKLDWEKIDEQNHYIEFFHLTDSAKFHLKEVVPNDFPKLARETFKESGYLGAVQELKSYENTVETKGSEAL